MLEDDRNSQTSYTPRFYYQLPVKLAVEDKLLILGPFSLTLRQSFILILGGCVAINIWRYLAFLTPFGTWGLVLQYGLTGFPVFIALIVAVVKIADRHLEDWALILARYLTLHKVYVWRPLPEQLKTKALPQPASKQKPHHSREEDENE